MIDKKKISCPEREVFLKAFLSELPAEEKNELLNHVPGCPSCRARFRLLSQVREELQKRDFPGPEEALDAAEERDLRMIAGQRLRELDGNRQRYLFNLIPARYAAAVALLLFAAGLFFILKLPQAEVLRSSENKGLQLINPEGKLGRPPSLFTWTPVAGAESYKFELIDDELNSIHSEKIRQTQLRLSPESVRKIVRGKNYIWTVEAYDDNDKKLDSASLSFDVR